MSVASRRSRVAGLLRARHPVRDRLAVRRRSRLPVGPRGGIGCRARPSPPRLNEAAGPLVRVDRGLLRRCGPRRPPGPPDASGPRPSAPRPCATLIALQVLPLATRREPLREGRLVEAVRGPRRSSRRTAPRPPPPTSRGRTGRSPCGDSPSHSSLAVAWLASNQSRSSVAVTRNRTSRGVGVTRRRAARPREAAPRPARRDAPRSAGSRSRPGS